MDHKDHVNLLRPANLKPGGTYADIGAGTGVFTRALRELVGPDATIYAVDKDKKALDDVQEEFLARLNSILNLHLVPLDFSRPLYICPLDGVIMANSLHYFKDIVSLEIRMSRWIKVLRWRNP